MLRHGASRWQTYLRIVSPDKPPLTRVGVDYFGPFEVKGGEEVWRSLHMLIHKGCPHRSCIVIGY